MDDSVWNCFYRRTGRSRDLYQKKITCRIILLNRQKCVIVYKKCYFKERASQDTIEKGGFAYEKK